MCGIVGMAGTITVKHENVFKDLLIIDSIRGPHSVGVVSVTANNEVNHFKKAMYPHDFLETQGFIKLMSKVHKVLIGHNRWATKGGINNNNAHPFEFENVIGVHNGTLTHQWRLPDSNNYAVDSENIYHSINKIGIKETYELIDGAATLVYYDKAKKVVQFIRNEERPLFYTYSSDRKVVFWASEDWMLEGILKKHKIPHTKIIDTNVDTLYTVKVGELVREKPLDKIYVKKLVPFIPQRTFFSYEPPTTNKSKDNVVAIGGNKKNKEVLSPVKKQYPIGSEINFTYNGPAWDERQHSIEVPCKEDPSITLRIFVRQIANRIKADIMESKGERVFSGIVNGYTYDDIVLVQGNSVAEEIEAIPDIDKEIAKYLENTIEFGGEVITREEFSSLRKSAKECCWCASPIQFENGNTFIDLNTTVCPECSDEPGVIDTFLCDH